MNNYNGSDLLIGVVVAMRPQLGGLGTKYHDPVIYSHLSEGETIPQFHLRAIQTKIETSLLQDETGQTNNLTGKYTMEL